MAINPEVIKEATAIIKFKDYKAGNRTKHKSIRRRHVEPWLGWSGNNRLEST